MRNGVCLKGTLFTPLSKTTATESLNVQLRKQLDTHVNLVHGFTTKGVPSRHENINVVVIRCFQHPLPAPDLLPCVAW